MDYSKLIAAARRARKNAYAPYSRFTVGAALLTAKGDIITGCNVENSSYSLTVCAERIALFKAVSERVTKFRAIAIASDHDQPVPPCGACRQVISELAGDVDVLLCGRRGKPVIMKLHQLYPLPFSKEDLERK